VTPPSNTSGFEECLHHPVVRLVAECLVLVADGGGVIAEISWALFGEPAGEDLAGRPASTAAKASRGSTLIFLSARSDSFRRSGRVSQGATPWVLPWGEVMCAPQYFLWRYAPGSPLPIRISDCHVRGVVSVEVV
jgi:hypothetical protein